MQGGGGIKSNHEITLLETILRVAGSTFSLCLQHFLNVSRSGVLNARDSVDLLQYISLNVGFQYTFGSFWQCSVHSCACA